MNRWIASFGAVLVLCLTDAARLNAQMGPLIDWIHKLSGPRFFQWGATFSLGYESGLKLDSSAVVLQTSRVDSFVTVARGRSGVAAPALAQLESDASSVRQHARRLSGDIRYRAKLVDRALTEVERIGREAVLRTPETDPQRLTAIAEALSVRLARVDSSLVQISTDMNALDRGNGARARLMVVGGSSVMSDDVKSPDTATVSILTISPTVEYIFIPQLAVELGVNLHYFFGDMEPFWNVSFPVLGVVRPLATHRSRWLRAIRANAGFNIFAPFEGQAFAPVSFVRERGFEFVFTGFISLDFPWDIYF